MPLIRDTIDPLNEREVSDEEALDLERYHILLTGTRAKTPDGLRAAAVRQVTEQLEGSVAAAAPQVAIGVGEPQDDPDDVDEDPDDDEVVDEDPDDDDPQTPGADAPDSTTDTHTDSQES